MSFILYRRIAERIELDVADELAAKQWLDTWLMTGSSEDDPAIRRIHHEESIGPDPEDPYSLVRK